MGSLIFNTHSCVYREAKTLGTRLDATGDICSQFLSVRDHNQGGAASEYTTPAVAFLAGAKAGVGALRVFHAKQKQRA